MSKRYQFLKHVGLTNENQSYGDIVNSVVRPPAWGFCSNDHCINQELFHGPSRYGSKGLAYYVVGIGVALVKSMNHSDIVCQHCDHALHWSRQYQHLDNEQARFNVESKSKKGKS